MAAVGAKPGALTRAAESMRWHGGKPDWHEVGRLGIATFVDDAEGPFVTSKGDHVTVVHGSASASVAELQKRQWRFAAAEWDGLTLRASRDPMGLAPLFYRVVDGATWLSTEIHPLVALGTPELDLEALSVQSAYVPLDERTGWKGIFRVVPGCVLELRPDRPSSSKRYWDPRTGIGTFRGSRDEAVRGLRLHVDAAIRRCCPPGGGMFLSGGLDSAALARAASAADLRPELVHVHFPGFQDTHEDAYASDVAASVGLPMETVVGDVDPWDPDAELDVSGIPYSRTPAGFDEPALRHLARRGVEVGVDGHDANGLLGTRGSEWADLLLHGRVGRLRQLAGQRGLVSVVGAVVRDFAPYGFPARPTALRTLSRYFGPPVASRMRAEDIERLKNPTARWKGRQLRPLLPIATISFEIRELIAARHGVDVRHPFADRDLVDFVISLPNTVKFEPSRNKGLLTDAFAGELPPGLLDRRLSDYMPVVRHRVDFDGCIEQIRSSGARLPHVHYDRLLAEASRPGVDRDDLPLFFLILNLARIHAFTARYN